MLQTTYYFKMIYVILTDIKYCIFLHRKHVVLIGIRSEMTPFESIRVKTNLETDVKIFHFSYCCSEVQRKKENNQDEKMQRPDV